MIKFVLYSFSLIFLVAGVSKMFYFEGFVQEVTQYFELYLMSVSSYMYKCLAVLLIIIEICIGICLFVKRIVLHTTVVLVILLSFFLYINSINYFFPSIIGSVESCGCFGELIHFTPALSFFKTLFLFLLSVYLLYSEICKK